MTRRPEAYRLMLYATKDAREREVLWNSREGRAPCCVASATTGEEMRQVDWEDERHVLNHVYAPNHVPKVGDRIFVDMTETRARVFAERRVERWLEHERSGTVADGLPRLEDMFESRAAAVQSAFEDIFKPGAPDILVVTAGFIEELERRRLTVEDPAGGAAAPESQAPAGEPIAYDRQVTPIYDFHEFGKLLADGEYKRVASTRVGKYHVSTVWLGVDHNTERSFGGDARPLIFETMVFGDGDTGGPLVELTERSHTEAEATKRHEQIVAVVNELHQKGSN